MTRANLHSQRTTIPNIAVFNVKFVEEWHIGEKYCINLLKVNKDTKRKKNKMSYS